MALLLFPLITTALLFVVFRKAGFPWSVGLFSFGPLVGSALPLGLINLAERGLLDLSASIYGLVPLLAVVLGIIPVALLAALPWRKEIGANGLSENTK